MYSTHQKQSLFITKRFNFFLIFFFIISCEANDLNTKKIELDDGNYLLPGPKNIDGCTEYQFMNKYGLPTTQVIYYVDEELNILDSYDKNRCI